MTISSLNDRAHIDSYAEPSTTLVLEDPIARSIQTHRRAVIAYERVVVDLEKKRDTTVLHLKAELADAEQAHRENVARINQAIAVQIDESAQKIAAREKMAAASRAALAVLET